VTTGSVLTTDVADAAIPDEPRPEGVSERARRYIENAIFALLVYVPILLMAPGKVESDTKSYLYLDPGRLLDMATTLWTPKVGMGGMSHQTIGYLFPMGPYYWVLDRIGMPDWIAQRLWLGTIIFLAGLGIRYLLRTLGVRGIGVPIAMVVYAFTPYVLGNSAQYTTLLGPWAAMPWWIAFMVLALRKGGWKYPALFALGVQLTAALNGTALIYGLIAPALWLLYAWLITRETSFRRLWTVVWRTGLLTGLTSLWWVISLSVEGEYGLNLLRFTESIRIVSLTSLPFEVLRGLGNWYFYGGDRNGLWSDARPFYTQRFWLLFISFLVPVLALAGAAIVKWKYKAFFVVLILVGTVIAVGSAPYDDPSIAGGIYKDLALESPFWFALRNTVRAVPMIALGLAVLLGIGANALVDALRRTRFRPYAMAAAGLVLVVCLASAVPALTGNYYNKTLQRDAEIPQYWQQAVRYLDARPHDTRVLALPGTSFATYRWGDMKDAVEPGLMDRGYVDRELVPAGSEPAANIVQSLDQRLQEGNLDTDAIAPVARLMGVGDVELRMDLKTDQYDLIPAGELWRTFTDPRPTGLGAPRTFGDRTPGKLEFPELGDLTKVGPKPPAPKPVAVFAVEDPLPIVRAKDTRAPLVVEGDGAGIVDTASADLLDARRLVLYAAPFEHDPAKLRGLAEDATLVVTDSNRRRATRWSGMTNNYGYTEEAGEQPLVHDPLDQRLEPFVGTTDASRTVTVLSGVKSIRANTYGNPSYQYATEMRPTQAMDGDQETAWLVDPAVPVGREQLRVELERPITTDRLNITQLARVLPSTPRDPRYISRIGLSFDGGPTIERSLGKQSRVDAGQTVAFPRRTFSTLELTIEGVHRNVRNGPAQMNAVGINELRLVDDSPGAEPIRITESQRLPTALLDAMGTKSRAHPLALVLSSDPTMDSDALSRTFSLPTDRSFAVTGQVQLGKDSDDDAVDRALGIPDASQGGITVTSTDRVPNVRGRASAAVDGDRVTAWVASVVDQQPAVRVQLPGPTMIDHLDLGIVADGRHSTVGRITIRADGGASQVVDLPRVPRSAPGGVADVPVSFDPMTGTVFEVEVTGARLMKRKGNARPMGIAELGIPGVERTPMPAQVPGRCTDDLVEVDGKPLSVRVTGTTADALSDRRPLTLTPCDATAALALASGTHQVTSRTAAHTDLGFEVKRLVLSSGAGGVAAPVVELATAGGRADPSPRVRVLSQDATSMKLRVDDASDPFWLVLGQSFNKGWEAKADGKTLDPPTLVDSYANGWRVRPTGSGPMTITVTWTPQRTFDIALIISVLATIACLVILAGAFVLRRRRATGTSGVDGDPAPVGDRLAIGAPNAPAFVGRGLPRPLPRRTVATVATVVGTGAVAALVVRPWVGLLVAAFVLLAIRSPGWRLAMRVVPPLLVLGIALYITVGQRLERFAPTFDWPTRFSEMSVPTWIAIVLLASDAVISMVWRTGAGDGTPDAERDRSAVSAA
jgi:arabinofuranan 3-O-arabinosyltransferase